MVLGGFALAIARMIDFQPSAVSSRAVALSLALAALPLALGAIACALKALQWLLLGMWPGSVGICASRDALRLRLGPFGNRSFDAGRLDVRYPFELEGEAQDGSFEAFLPEEEQRARLLPRITHPDATEPVNLMILKHTAGAEEAVTKTLRPMFDLWRATTPRGTNDESR